MEADIVQGVEVHDAREGGEVPEVLRLPPRVLGRRTTKTQAVGIWECDSCGKTKAGGAYVLNTASGITVRSTIRRLRDSAEK